MIVTNLAISGCQASGGKATIELIDRDALADLGSCSGDWVAPRGAIAVDVDPPYDGYDIALPSSCLLKTVNPWALTTGNVHVDDLN